MTPRAVTLDAYGTLLAMDDPAPHLRASLRTRLGLDLPLERCAAGMRAEIARYHALPSAGDPTALAAVRAECAGVLAAALGHGLDGPAVAPCLLDAVRFRPLPGVLDALARLARAGLPTAVVSNWDVSLHDVLVQTGLRPHLRAVVLSAEAGARKPDPRLYAIACARLGVAPRDALHVGDEPRHDVDAARAAGLRAVLVSAAPVPARQPAIAGVHALPRLLGLPGTLP